jgi:hypothetical protein
MTYDLRRLRLRLHGIIERIPRTFRYRLTGYGPEVATAYTLAHDRVLRPGTALLTAASRLQQVRLSFLPRGLNIEPATLHRSWTRRHDLTQP